MQIFKRYFDYIVNFPSTNSYLQNRLIPYFGKDPQTSTVYYQKKMKIYCYGIVSPSNDKKQIYIIDHYNAAGDKDANLKLNLLLQYV